jgi:hydroxyacylglutathione hydrolase
MFIQQLYTGCLAEAAYYIESNGEAAIIDPLRETEPYIELAESRGAKIKFVFESHFHADFVSGHIDLARKTGATIVFGPGAQPEYKAYVAKDGEELALGKIKFKVLHTPGHTQESSCFLLIDEQGDFHAVFTGDTLFVGDVGRPDLAVKSDLTQEDLAGMLYESLNNKIKTLPDHTIVYPAHGAGSACGKNIGKETFSTIGEQKRTNYALQPMSKDAFVIAVTEGLTAPPQYFFHDAMVNKKGYDNIDEVMDRNTKCLSVEEFEKASIDSQVIILDARTPDEFEKGFVPGSINIGLNGQYAPWVGSLIDPKAAIYVVSEEGKQDEAVLRLARVGYENVKGVLDGGFPAWKNSGKKYNTINSVDAPEFAKQLKEDSKIIDVRKWGEQLNGVVPNADLIELSELEKNICNLKEAEHYFIYCAGGYRSMIAASLLMRSGFKNLTNVRGGMGKIKETAIKLVMPQEV